MASLTTYALATLLVASVGFNVRLYTRSAPTPAPARARAVESDTAPAPSRSDGTCERRLAECQRQAWEIAARAIADDHPPGPAPIVEAGPDSAGVAAQAAALCGQAKLALRDSWRRDGVLLAANLKRSFNDREEQERNLSRELASMREIAGLDPQQAASMESAYRDRRAAAVATARAAFDRDPPDLGAVVDSARGVFADEDALLGRFAGDSGREAWRAHELDSRTTLLALLATLADREWDDAIRW